MNPFVQLSARGDILLQYRYYVEEADRALADRFLAAVEESFNAIVALPNAGAPRSSTNPRLAGLRTWPVKGFEDIRVYYLVRSDLLLIVRVLHGRRDIGVILKNEELEDPPARPSD